MLTRSLRAFAPLLIVLAIACTSPTAPPTSAPAPTVASSAAPAGATGTTAPAGVAPVPKPTPKPAPVAINFAYPAIASQFWYVFVAEEKNLFADEAIDFKPTFVQAGAPAIAQGVVAGAYQIASVSGDIGIAAIENGADLVYVASGMHVPMFSIAVQPEIKSFADIKNNKTVGAASVRGGTATLLRVIFGQHGLKEGTDYTIIAAGSTGERVAALQNRSIDIGMLAQPQDFQMEDAGFRILGMTNTFIKDWGQGEIAVKRTWAKANEDVVVRFIRGLSRTIDWMYDPKNKDEAIRILGKATKLEENYARRTYELLIEKEKTFVLKGEPAERAIDGTIKVLIDGGEIQRSSVTGAQAVDKSYWQKAQESLKTR